MLYPSDSLTFKKVQMKEERIYVQLYKGYAVVKGTYFLQNTTQETLNFKMGYPLNGIYSGGGWHLNQVKIDLLSKFKIRSNDVWIHIIEQQNEDYGKINSLNENWKVWQMNFLPKESKILNVYFIVNTNYGTVVNGYNSKRTNAFIYLLESGNVWKNPIDLGRFYIQLMDGLTTKNVHGISKNFEFKFNHENRIFYGTKSNFIPTTSDNLVITYFKNINQFDYDKKVEEAEELFTTIDQMSELPLNSLSYEEILTNDPYHVDNTFLGYIPFVLTSFITYAPFVIISIAMVIFIWGFIKWKKILVTNKEL